MDASERPTIAEELELARERLAKEEAVFDAAFLGIEPPR